MGPSFFMQMFNEMIKFLIICPNTKSSEYDYYYNNPMGAAQVNEFGVGNAYLGSIAYGYGMEGQVINRHTLYGGDNYESYLKNTYDKGNRLLSTSISKNGTNGFYTNLVYDRTRLSKVQTNGAQAADTSGGAYVTYETGLMERLKM